MKMKKLIGLSLAAALSIAMAVPAFAGQKITSGNGYIEYYDDGSYLEYNARGSSYTYHDVDGETYSWNGDEEQSGSSSSSSGSSSSKYAKYAGASITDAYWSYSNGSLTAKWDADYRSKANYTVTLYLGSKKITSKTSNGGSSVNFSEAVASKGETGNYYFKVKAKWPGKYTDEEESDDYYVDSSKLHAIQNRHSGGSSSGGSSASSGGGPSGTTAGAWQNYNGIWRYLKANGQFAANGWEYINGKWYYFDAYGNMVANQWIVKADNPHVYYYVGPDGDMLVNQYIGQWYVNANGECWV
ncbi:MAG: hypothetical protein J5947_01240 [Clostridium sp.]|nr:hypothetical protein [Clostridium sp.]